WLVGFRVAVLVTVVGIVFFGVFVLGLADWSSGFDLFRRSVVTWLFASGSSVHLAGVSVGFIPLGLVAIKGVIAYWFTAWSIGKAPVDPKIFVPVTAFSSGIVAAVLSVIVSAEALSVPMFRTARRATAVVGGGSALA